MLDINQKCNLKTVFIFFTSLALPDAENCDLGTSTGGLSHLHVIFFFKGLCSAVVWEVSFACLFLSPFLWAGSNQPAEQCAFPLWKLAWKIGSSAETVVG